MKIDQFLVDFFAFLQFAKWMFLAAVMLVVADLYFGILAAKKRGDLVKKSRAVRRTIDKFVSYLVWIILAYTFGQAFLPFGIELLPLTMLVIVYVVELESIYSNYFQYKGKKLKFNILKLLKLKFGINLDDVIEEAKDDTKDTHH